MKNSWLVWLFVIVVVVTIIAVFNHQSAQQQKPLSQIFPTNEEVMPVDVEYEYAESGAKSAVPAGSTTAVPQPASGTAAVKSTAASATPTTTPTFGGEVQKVEALGAESAVPAPAYTIQIGSYKKQSQADDAVVKLKKEGHDAFVLSRNLGAKGVWYRVYTGRFTSKSEAQAYLPKLQEKYKGAFVIAPK